jgi:hypothetical protein
MKRRPMPMISRLAGHVLAQLEKLIEEIASSALHLRECASMRANPEVERPIQCRSTFISSESYGELGHHT